MEKSGQCGRKEVSHEVSEFPCERELQSSNTHFDNIKSDVQRIFMEFILLLSAAEKLQLHFQCCHALVYTLLI